MNGTALARWTPALPWLTATVALLATAWVFYPGFLSFDSAYQWYQVRTGTWDNVHPVLMTALWSLTDRVLPGPGGYFLLQLTGFWLGLAALATGLFRRPRAQVMAVLALGLFPPVLALLPHLWKDLGLLVALIWACALLAHERRCPRRSLRLGALAWIGIACAFRHNALPLAVPLVWYLAGREPWSIGRDRQGLLALAMLLVVTLMAVLPNRWPGVVDRKVWPVTALWDLAAVSISEQRMLLPAELIDPTLTVAELEQHFVPFNNVTIFETGKIYDSVSGDLTSVQRKALDRAWGRLWIKHPRAMLAHRARLSGLLFGLQPGRLPAGMVMQPGVVPLADNPALPMRRPAMQAAWLVVIQSPLAAPLFAFWFYALVLLALALLQAVRGGHALAWPLLWSVLLYLAPLPLVAPSAEFRYLLWPVFATVLLIALRYVAHEPPAPTASTPPARAG